MSQMTELHRRAIYCLRELYDDFGSQAWHSLDRIAEELGCDPDLLFEKDDRTGILADLEADGKLMRIDTDFIAVGRMDWE